MFDTDVLVIKIFAFRSFQILFPPSPGSNVSSTASSPCISCLVLRALLDELDFSPGSSRVIDEFLRGCHRVAGGAHVCIDIGPRTKGEALSAGMLEPMDKVIHIPIVHRFHRLEIRPLFRYFSRGKGRRCNRYRYLDLYASS